MKRISRPASGIPTVRRTPAELDVALNALREGSGPIAIDTERAAMYRFDDRAYLIQLRREGAGTFIVDPTGHPAKLREWQDALLAETPWLLHAAHTDLPALLALGWQPSVLLDTQIAARLLGCHRLGLSLLLEEFLSISIPKNKGNADWSQRPLPNSMLAYAALDVEYLVPMHDMMIKELAELNRLDWYRQECEHDRLRATPLAAPQWTDMKGASFLRPGTRAAIVAEALFETRTKIARSADIPPERLLSSKTIMSLAPQRFSAAKRDLTAEFDRLVRGPGADRVNPHRHNITLLSLLDALSRAHNEPATAITTQKAKNANDKDDELFGSIRPDAKAWEEDYPQAWVALEILRESNQELSESLGISADAIMVARQMKFVAWEFTQRLNAPEFDPGDVDAVEELLGNLLQHAGLRPWQVELVLNDATPYLLDEVVDGATYEESS